MVKNLSDIVDGNVYFTNELSSVMAEGQADTAQCSVTVNGSDVLDMEFFSADSGIIKITSMGEMIRMALVKQNLSLADTTIKIGSVSKSFKALRCDRPFFNTAENFCKENFLSDVGVIITSAQRASTTGYMGYSVKVYSYDPSSTAAKATVYRKTRGIETYDSIPMSVENGLCVYTPNITAWMLQNTGTPIVYGPFTANFSAGSREIMIEAVTILSGMTFVFENSFGLPESIFIPGIISQSPELSRQEYTMDGALGSVDRQLSTSYTVTAEAAPLWLFEAAKLLAKSPWVETSDNPAQPTLLGYGRKVEITGVSGTGHDAPNSLCTIKITFKYSEQ